MAISGANSMDLGPCQYNKPSTHYALLVENDCTHWPVLPKGTKVGISHTHSLCFSSFWELPDLPRKPPLIGRSPPHPTRLSHIQNIDNATTSRLVPFHSLVLLSYSSSLRLATYAFDIVSRSLTSVRPPFNEVRSVSSFVKAP